MCLSVKNDRDSASAADDFQCPTELSSVEKLRLLYCARADSAHSKRASIKKRALRHAQLISTAAAPDGAAAAAVMFAHYAR